MTREGDALTRTLAIAGVGLLLALVAAFVLTATFDRPAIDRRPRLATLLRIKLVVTTFNAVLLLALAGIYADLYRDLPNPFTLSLILFSLALLLYAVTANPILPLVFGFRGAVNLGPFTYLPDLFASVAVVVLLYQSQR